jgi:hypothetical protein
MLNLDTNKVTPEGGLKAKEAAAMKLQPKLLEEFALPKVTIESGAKTGADKSTSAHMRNWMECIRSRKQTNAPVEAGYSHAIACIMANAAYRTGMRVTFDEKKQQVMAGNKPFKY